MLKKRVFSTGPMENTISVDEFAGPTVSQFVFVKALNNGDQSSTVEIKAFELNGEKIKIDKQKINLPAKSSNFVIFDVSEAAEWEIQINVKDKCDDVLLSVWGKDESGNLVPEHRVVHQELTPMF